jgi:hypothetical protein
VSSNLRSADLFETENALDMMRCRRWSMGTLHHFLGELNLGTCTNWGKYFLGCLGYFVEELGLGGTGRWTMRSAEQLQVA